MPSLEWNLKRWGETHDWSRQGEEWSDGIGGSTGQWYWWLYPRIHWLLPAKRILEIAPGFGRWTQFLLEHTGDRLIGVDIARRCIDACVERFAASDKFEGIVNDGYTMPAVASGSVDFVFTFGSLIHAENDVFESYVPEIARVLGEDGVAFIHHSNAGALGYDGAPPRSHAGTVSAASVAAQAEKAGLVPALQEIFAWGTPLDQPISCMSILAKPKSRFARPLLRFTNERVDADAEYVDRMSQIYAVSEDGE